LPLYQRVIEIFQPRVEAKAILTAPENLALAASEDGLALALLDSDRTKEAIPHLERAFQVARDLTAPTRGGILYNLACAHARLGNAAVAIEKLIEAESQQSGCLARAHTDKDFDPIRESKRFQDLLNGDRGNY
jgi:tetratricopeptide (TPR) repeat protein